MSETPQRINALEIRDFMRIRVLRVAPEGNMVKIVDGMVSESAAL